MTKAKHTPGPWIFTSEKECFSPDDYDGDDRGYYAVSGSPEFQIHDPIPGVRYADAKLMAAAPELLEALRTCLGELEERYDLEASSTNPGIKIAAEAARDAIHKATN